jgi:hypothetical protein
MAMTLPTLEQFLKQQALRIADRDRLVNEPDRRHIDGEDQLCFLCKSQNLI